jgi:hypothetical protein
MDDYITSSFVYDKTYKRFTILNLYDDDENENQNQKNKQITSNEIIQKKEAFETNKCYCIIM